MYAVATIHFKQSVDVSRLVAKLAAPTEPPTAINATIFATKPAVMVTALTASQKVLVYEES